MLLVVFQALGVLIFLAGSAWLAGKVHRTEALKTVENASRVSHALFWCALVLPGVIGLIRPGFTAYDDLLGLPELPGHTPWMVAGVVLLGAGMMLMAGSNRYLMKRGHGAPAFLLTETLVIDGLYGWTRNPMSLGFYATCLGIGMIAGSTAVTLGVLLVVVPVHVFNLKYFEERELERRYGDSYVAYRAQVPFLIPRLKRG